MSKLVKFHQSIPFKAIIHCMKFFPYLPYSISLCSSGIRAKFSCFFLLELLALWFLAFMSFITRSLWVTVDIMTFKLKINAHLQYATIVVIIFTNLGLISLFARPKLSLKFLKVLQNLYVENWLLSKSCFRIFLIDPLSLLCLILSFVIFWILGTLLDGSSVIDFLFQLFGLCAENIVVQTSVAFLRFCFFVFGNSLKVSAENYKRCYFESDYIRKKALRKFLREINRVKKAKEVLESLYGYSLSTFLVACFVISTIFLYTSIRNPDESTHLIAVFFLYLLDFWFICDAPTLLTNQLSVVSTAISELCCKSLNNTQRFYEASVALQLLEPLNYFNIFNMYSINRRTFLIMLNSLAAYLVVLLQM